MTEMTSSVERSVDSVESKESISNDNAVKTMCSDWSLNHDKSTERYFWWHGVYGISIWSDSLAIDKKCEQIDDNDVWGAYLHFQLENNFKLCTVCHLPEFDDDMYLCCYCGSTVHKTCSTKASASQIAWKIANASFDERMRVCLQCADASHHCLSKSYHLANEAYNKWTVNNDKINSTNDDCRTYLRFRRCALRTLSLSKELQPALVTEIKNLLENANEETCCELHFEQLRKVTLAFFQPSPTLSLFHKHKIVAKGDGVGVIATCRIPAFTLVGIYPGYLDLMSGEQVKLGRPAPKYALMDLNCADYNNCVYTEFEDTLTPYINEPSLGEKSNCAWIQEVHYLEGRLSIITIEDLNEGAELLIGYGPLYPRQYMYEYDAYSLQRVEGYSEPYCYALWRWTSTESAEGQFIKYVGYSSEDRKYFAWSDSNDTLPCTQHSTDDIHDVVQFNNIDDISNSSTKCKKQNSEEDTALV